MAESYKDWELPNSRIWLAEIDIDRDLDFLGHLDWLNFTVKKLQIKTRKYWLFPSKNNSGSDKKPGEKKSKEDEQTLADLIQLIAKWPSLQTDRQTDGQTTFI